MLIIPCIKFLQLSCENKYIKINHDCRNTLFNKSHRFLLKREEIEHIENSIENKDFLQAFLSELSDSGRLISDENKINKDEDFIVNLCATNKTSSKYPIINIFDSKDEYIFNLINYNEKTLDFNHFRNNEEINRSIERLINLNRNKHKIIVINRELRHRFIKSLSIINYYTLNNYRGNNTDFLSDVKEWKKEIPNIRTKVYFTKNRRIIHERKILVGNLIITFDNDFDNILTSEPTWIINLKYDNNLVYKIRHKLEAFNKLNFS